MQLEVGKYYRTRDGRKVGPMCNFVSFRNMHPFTYCGMLWTKDGIGYEGKVPDQDIIAEWTDELPQNTQPILSGHTIDHIAMDSLRYHYATEMEPLQKDAFRIVLRYYGVTV